MLHFAIRQAQNRRAITNIAEPVSQYPEQLHYPANLSIDNFAANIHPRSCVYEKKSIETGTIEASATALLMPTRIPMVQRGPGIKLYSESAGIRRAEGWPIIWIERKRSK